MPDKNQTAGEVTAALSNAPWPVAEARVSIPEPGHPGFRIVGYRVPAETPDFIQSVFDLAARDNDVVLLRAENVRLLDKYRRLVSIAERLIDTVDTFIRDSSDPDTEALAAVRCAKQELQQP